jgi:topoisomerase IV subunit B
VNGDHPDARLMGKNPQHRFVFIQENAARVDGEVIDA